MPAVVLREISRPYSIPIIASVLLGRLETRIIPCNYAGQSLVDFSPSYKGCDRLRRWYSTTGLLGFRKSTSYKKDSS